MSYDDFDDVGPETVETDALALEAADRARRAAWAKGENDDVAVVEHARAYHAAMLGAQPPSSANGWTSSCTYGELVMQWPGARGRIENHDWDNKSPSEQRDWLIGQLGALRPPETPPEPTYGSHRCIDGADLPWSSLLCSRCRGVAGETPLKPMRCERCNGTGREPGGNLLVLCQACDGRGVVGERQPQTFEYSAEQQAAEERAEHLGERQPPEPDLMAILGRALGERQPSPGDENGT